MLDPASSLGLVDSPSLSAHVRRNSGVETSRAGERPWKRGEAQRVWQGGLVALNCEPGRRELGQVRLGKLDEIPETDAAAGRARPQCGSRLERQHLCQAAPRDRPEQGHGSVACPSHERDGADPRLS